MPAGEMESALTTNPATTVTATTAVTGAATGAANSNVSSSWSTTGRRRGLTPSTEALCPAHCSGQPEVQRGEALGWSDAGSPAPL